MSTRAFNLEGQVAAVTGGGTGIGRAVAKLLAEHGADVIVASRRMENLQQTVEQVTAIGRRAIALRTDVRKPDDCRKLIADSLESFGRLDILVNNAGGSRSYRFDEWSDDEFDNSIALNLRSVFILSQHAAGHMVSSGRGSIVNISSVASERPMPGLGPYGMAKAGVNNLTRTMAAHYGPYGIRVNCVCVGFVHTDGFVRALTSVRRDPEEVGRSASALGRTGTPEEIAYAVLFLSSEAASFVSGEILHVDGGMTAVGPW